LSQSVHVGSFVLVPSLTYERNVAIFIPRGTAQLRDDRRGPGEAELL
jgi:hypothetical protein